MRYRSLYAQWARSLKPLYRVAACCISCVMVDNAFLSPNRGAKSKRCNAFADEKPLIGTRVATAADNSSINRSQGEYPPNLRTTKVGHPFARLLGMY